MKQEHSPEQNEIIFYSTPDGMVRIEVFFQSETFWLSQKKIADLFGVDTRTINEHLQSIYKSHELQREATIWKIRIVQKREVVRWREKWILQSRCDHSCRI